MRAEGKSLAHVKNNALRGAEKVVSSFALALDVHGPRCNREIADQGFHTAILGQKTATRADFRPEASDLGLHFAGVVILVAWRPGNQAAQGSFEKCPLLCLRA